MGEASIRISRIVNTLSKRLSASSGHERVAEGVHRDGQVQDVVRILRITRDEFLHHGDGVLVVLQRGLGIAHRFGDSSDVQVAAREFVEHLFVVGKPLREFEAFPKRRIVGGAGFLEPAKFDQVVSARVQMSRNVCDPRGTVGVLCGLALGDREGAVDDFESFLRPAAGPRVARLLNQKNRLLFLKIGRLGSFGDQPLQQRHRVASGGVRLVELSRFPRDAHELAVRPQPANQRPRALAVHG